MPSAPLPLNEAERLFALRALQLLNTPAEERFDRVTRLLASALEVPIATLDARFAQNPFVTGEPHIRFYAGQPIMLHQSLAIGALCAIDTRPRTLTPAQRSILRDLADIVQAEIASMTQAQQAHELRQRK